VSRGQKNSGVGGFFKNLYQISEDWGGGAYTPLPHYQDTRGDVYTSSS